MALACWLLALVLAACSLGGAPAAPTTAPAATVATQATAAASPANTTPLPTPPAAPGTARASGPAATPRTPSPAASPAAAGTPPTPPRRAANATAVPNTAPAAAAALINQAVGLLLDHYVDPLDSATLYGAAHDRLAGDLRALGRTVAVARPAFSGDPAEDAARFERAYLALMEAGGQDLNQTALAYAALDAVAAALDECHTVFLDPEQYTQYTTRLEGNETYAGVGVYLQRSRPVVVGEVFPGTPAERAGLRAGDAILAVDGQDVTGLGADQLGPLVRGREGTRVTLTVQRPSEPAPRDVTMTRAQITVPVFNSRVVDGPNGQKVGYLRLYSFSQGAEGEIDRALREFARQGVRGWVLDLRDNGGGYIHTLAAVAGRFTPGVTIGYRVYRGGQEDPQLTEPTAGVEQQLPLAVLVDAGSASASEWFAAAMQDLGRARVFGETTAGCLAGASTYPLADGSAMSITIEKVVSPQRREINRVGARPDEEVAAAGTGDPVLARALAWLATQPR